MLDGVGVNSIPPKRIFYDADGELTPTPDG
jgi:hypothetical protein